MKCLCGHIEPETIIEDIEVRFQSGKRKGELKRIEERVIDPNPNDLFIALGIEKGFGFTRSEKYFNDNHMTYCLLYACPKCGTVKLGDVND